MKNKMGKMCISIVTLNINQLIVPMNDMGIWVDKEEKGHTYLVYKRPITDGSLVGKRTHRLKIKRWKSYLIQVKRKIKAEIAILINIKDGQIRLNTQ